VLEPSLIAYWRGKLDRKQAPASIRSRRAKLLGWLCTQVDAPELAAAIAR
jgi:hypothetical protein